ncbi:hypothetical protein C8J57DRAFT_1243201 [Mycena rebaudengoi]|nr:hypothetical protein C8J57DRAFT_1243201 [Mycena rebaudengoi]
MAATPGVAGDMMMAGVDKEDESDTEFELGTLFRNPKLQTASGKRLATPNQRDIESLANSPPYAFTFAAVPFDSSSSRDDTNVPDRRYLHSPRRCLNPFRHEE